MADVSGTSGGQAVSTEYAGFGRRLLGLIIDGIVIAVIAGVLSFALGAAGVARLYGFVGAEAVVALVYYTWGWGSGQTVGCMVMNMRLADQDTGSAPGYAKGLIRAIVVLVLSYGATLAQLSGSQALGILGLLGLVGDLWMLWDAKKQTWQDKVAGTIVVSA